MARWIGSMAGGRRRAREAAVLLAVCSSAPAIASDKPSHHVTGGMLPASSILIDGDDRLSYADFARRHNIPLAKLQSRFGATGVVRCGSAVGTGQLVGSTGVVVTAAHVLFEPGGHPRGEGGNCTFEIVTGGVRQVVPIDVAQVTCGATEPYAKPAIRDWAVAPLARPVAGVRAYRLGPSLTVPGKVVLAAAARTGGIENHSLELCSARQVTSSSPSGIREVAVDCDAEAGTSGAAFLTPEGGFVGVYVGFRSAHPGAPGPFSMSHYNFGVSADGDLRSAIMETVARTQPLSASR